MKEQSLSGSDRERKFFDFVKKLTSREKDILCLLLMNEGIRYKEIAGRLYLNSSTIRKHASNIYVKADVENKKQLLTLCEGFESFLMGCEPQSMKSSQKKGSLSEMLLTESDNKHYFEVFSDLIQAMHQLDFSKRLVPSANKHSFYNLVAEGMNLVNDKLESNFMSQEVIPKLIESLSSKNRVVLLSKDGDHISHAFSSIGVGNLNPKRWVGLKLSDFIGESRKTETDQAKFSVDLNQNFIPVYMRGEAEFRIEHLGQYKILTISIFPETNFSEKMPRILTLLSSLKSQFDDNPALSQTVVGSWVYNEVNDLYKELEEFIFL